jgi:hypothetical protein
MAYAFNQKERIPKKITQEQIDQVAKLRATGMTGKDIAKDLNMCTATVYNICKNLPDVGKENRYKLAQSVRQRFLAGECYDKLRKECKMQPAAFSNLIYNRSYCDENYNPPISNLNPNTKFTVDDIISIRKRYADGELAADIAMDFTHIKCNPTETIRRIVRREVFKKIP